MKCYKEGKESVCKLYIANLNVNLELQKTAEHARCKVC